MFRNRSYQGIAILWGLLMLAPGVQAKPASVEANREWVKTAVQDKVNAGELDQALQILKEHLKSDAEDSVSWAQMALIQRYLYKCEDAQASLLQAANMGPSGQKEIYSVAASELRARGCGPVSAKELATPGADATTESPWSSSARLLVGYDSNVLLLSDALNVGAASESGFLTPTANFSYHRKKEAGVLNARSVTSYTTYLDADLRNMETLNQSLTVEWEPNQTDSVWEQNFSNRFDIFLVNSDNLKFFSWTNIVRASFSREAAEKSRWGFDLAGGYQKYSADTAPTSDDNRDGLLATPSVWYAQRLSRFVWTSALIYSQSFASGDNYKTQGVTLSTGLNGMISESTRARINYAWTHSDYNQSATDRKDDRSELSVGLSRAFSKLPDANFSLDYFYTDNESNLTGAGYRRGIIMGQVDYAF